VQLFGATHARGRLRQALTLSQAHAAPGAGVEERSLLFAYRQQQQDAQPQLRDGVASNIFSVGDRVILQVRFRIHMFPSLIARQ
jgi:hypothetical protein